MLKNINFVGILGIIVGFTFLYVNISQTDKDISSQIIASVWPAVVIISAIASFFLPRKDDKLR